jgi:hypothetical protein
MADGDFVLGSDGSNCKTKMLYYVIFNVAQGGVRCLGNFAPRHRPMLILAAGHC